MTQTKTALGAALAVLIPAIIVGLLLLLIPTHLLISLVFIIMGIVTVISSIPGIIVGVTAFSTTAGKISLVASVISAIFGFLMIFSHNELLMILLGVYMIVLPVVNILLTNDHMTQLKAELPKIIIGLVLLILGPANTLDFLLRIAGWVIIALGVIYALVLFFGVGRAAKRATVVTGGKIYVDVDGDGTVDGVDVDGNGTVDVVYEVPAKDTEKED